MPMFKIDPQKMTTEEINQRRQQWSDYVRKRLHPTKTCAKCKQTHPNDRAHFQINDQGRLLSVCTACPPVAKRTPAQPRKQMCPCCEKPAVLTEDKNAPAPVFVCRGCLNLVNSLEAADRATLDRMANYVEWRRQGHRLNAQPLPPAQ